MNPQTQKLEGELNNSSRNLPPYKNLSKEAYKFVSQSIGANWETADFSPSGVAGLRADNSEFGALAWERVKESCPVSLTDETIGSVSCQWVTPPSVLGSEIVLFLYGGAFVVGSPEDDLSMTARIATCMGRRVCVPRYKLAPENHFPVAFNQVSAVYCALINHIQHTQENKQGNKEDTQSTKANNERSKNSGICIVGESAGGNLALGLTIDICKNISIPPPFAVALLSPWLDLTHSGDSHITLFGLDPTLSVQHFLKPASLAYAGPHSLSSPQISPLFAEIPGNFPPILISTATRDLLLSDCTRLAKKLSTKNCLVDLRVAEGLWHVYEWYPECPEAIESLNEIATFLKRFCNTLIH